MKKNLLIISSIVLSFFAVRVSAGENAGAFYKDGQVNGLPETIHPLSEHSFHFISHGRPGELLIQGQWRNAAGIVQFIQQTRLLQESIKQLNIYGCEFARGAKGAAAVQYIQQRLQVAVAASVNITGRGGDYLLEIGNVNAAPLFAGFNGSLQCAGTPGGTAPGDDFDKDGICNSVDIDDDNDGILDTAERCETVPLNAAGYTNGAAVTTTTTTPMGQSFTTSFTTEKSQINLSAEHPDGNSEGRLDYRFVASQGSPDFFNYLTKLTFNKPVKVRLVFPGADAPGEHNPTDEFTLITPESTAGFTVFNPDSAITIMGRDSDTIRYKPNSGDLESEIGVSKQGYFVETNEAVLSVQIRAGNTRNNSINDMAIKVIIEICQDDLNVDNDAYPNYLDLDSDGDGCADAQETGIGGTLLPGTMMNSNGPAYSPAAIAQGDYGANGFANALETAPESGIYNASYSSYTNATNNNIASCAPTLQVKPDVNVGFPDRDIQGDLSTNDSLPPDVTYGSAVPFSNNPTMQTPTVNPNGTYTFTPTEPGLYQFNVPVCPPSVSTNCPQSLLIIHVVQQDGPNNLPVTVPDFATTPQNTAVTIKTLLNDEPGQSTTQLVPSSMTITTQPKQGTAVVDVTTGNIQYTPNNGFTGLDTLYYTVCDNASPPLCNTGLQIITVLPPLAANTVEASDDYISLRNSSTSNGNVTANDYDPDGTTTLTVTPQNKTVAGVGTFTLNSDGSYSFDPVDDFIGSANFSYQVCDGNSPTPACKSATAFFLVSERKLGAVAPVKLIGFWGRQAYDGNTLTWITAMERNSSYFEVRHSSNGSNFTPIATLPAAGNSDSLITYTYLHTKPNGGNNFYQLLQVDKDGSRESSRIINITTRRQNETVLYPNPSNGVFELRGNEEDISTIAVFNSTGANITPQVKIVRMSEKNLRVNMTLLPKGIYYLKTKTQGFKIIKQ